jgi:hypothetical protein
VKSAGSPTFVPRRLQTALANLVDIAILTKHYFNIGKAVDENSMSEYLDE